MTKSCPWALTTPNTGSTVVNGYSATLGFALEHREINVDLPALGHAKSPTSASSFNSRNKISRSPRSPFWAYNGAWLVGDTKRVFPQPPRPP